MAALCLKHATDLSNLVVHDLLLLFDLVSKNRLEIISLAVNHDDPVKRCLWDLLDLKQGSVDLVRYLLDQLAVVIPWLRLLSDADLVLLLDPHLNLIPLVDQVVVMQHLLLNFLKPHDQAPQLYAELLLDIREVVGLLADIVELICGVHQNQLIFELLICFFKFQYRV